MSLSIFGSLCLSQSEKSSAFRSRLLADNIPAIESTLCWRLNCPEDFLLLWNCRYNCLLASRSLCLYDLQRFDFSLKKKSACSSNITSSEDSSASSSNPVRRMNE